MKKKIRRQKVKHARRFINISAICRPNLGAGTEWSCETDICGRTVNGGSVDSTSEVRGAILVLSMVWMLKRRQYRGLQSYEAFRLWRYERTSKSGKVWTGSGLMPDLCSVM